MRSTLLAGLSVLDRGIGALSRFFAIIAAILLLALMLGISADVTRRFLTGEAIPGVTAYSEVALVMAVFLGLSFAFRTDVHVSVDILVRRLSPKGSKRVGLLGDAVLGFVVMWLIIESVPLALESYVEGEYRFGLARVPLWPARFAIPVGGGLLAAEILMRIASRIYPGHDERHTVGGLSTNTRISGI